MKEARRSSAVTPWSWRSGMEGVKGTRETFSQPSLGILLSL